MAALLGVLDWQGLSARVVSACASARAASGRAGCKAALHAIIPHSVRARSACSA